MEENNEEVVSRGIALAEVTSWLDYKRVSAKRREEKKEAIESLVSYVQDGTVTINSDNFEVIQKLNFPIGNVNKVHELIWKPNGNVGKVQIYMKGVESTDFTGNCIAVACAQTDQSKNMINALDHEDTAVMKVISVFFM